MNYKFAFPVRDTGKFMRISTCSNIMYEKARENINVKRSYELKLKFETSNSTEMSLSKSYLIPSNYE